MSIGSQVASQIGRASSVLAAVALVGCQSAYRDNADSVVQCCRQGDLTAAATIANTAALDFGIDDDDGVAVFLEAGRASQLAGDYATSIRHFDEVYGKIRPYLDAAAEMSIGEEFTSVVVNQTTTEYLGTAPERIMLNTLQALNHLSLNDIESARVELRRAYDWQQDAVSRNAAEIELMQDAGKAEAESRGIDMDAVYADPDVAATLASHYDALDSMVGYADFVNPFTTYLQGVVLLGSGDRTDAESAREYFSRVSRMVEGDAAEFAAEDLAHAERIAGGAAAPPTTWVFFLTGMSPARREFRVDLPIPVGNVNYVSAAFPYLELSSDFIKYLTVETDTQRRTALLTDVDAIVARDFSDKLTTIVLKEVLSSVVKAYATYELREHAGLGGQLAGIAYQAATTAADLRMWRTMPKRVLVARLPTPDDGLVHLVRPSGNSEQIVEVAPGESHVIVVSSPSRRAGLASIFVSDLGPDPAAVN